MNLIEIEDKSMAANNIINRHLTHLDSIVVGQWKSKLVFQLLSDAK